MKKFKNLFIIFSMFALLVACTTFDAPIDDFTPEEFSRQQIEKIAETAALGPKVIEREFGSTVNRRIYIDENVVTDYTKIIDKTFAQAFPISINFDNVDIRTVMETFSVITGKNILVGDEVKGMVKARIINEDWDSVLQAILEIKNIALTLNTNTNIVRIHSKDVLSAQEEYNRKRKLEVRLAMELSKSIEPVRSEIFKLYYSSPNTVKGQINEILANMDSAAAAGEGLSEAASATTDRVKITVDDRLRALIVLGGNDDLNFIERLIDQIDVPTRQILIEAFVVTVTDSFEEQLGSRLGAAYGTSSNSDYSIAAGGTMGVAGSSTVNTLTPQVFGSTAKSVGTIASNTITSATGSLGMILDAKSIDLNLELSAMEKEGITKMIANPKVFTLDNQKATITQGVQVPYTSVSSSGSTVELKNANLTLDVTPSIVGDGNVILDISVTNDSVADATASNPPIDSVAVTTKLLVADESIVIIGGIYTDQSDSTRSKTPGVGDIPIFGNLFKMKQDKDTYKRIFIFIAPKII
jgi:type IV pilus assembly protein PilQ